MLPSAGAFWPVDYPTRKGLTLLSRHSGLPFQLLPLKMVVYILVCMYEMDVELKIMYDSVSYTLNHG